MVDEILVKMCRNKSLSPAVTKNDDHLNFAATIKFTIKKEQYVCNSSFVYVKC